MTTKSTARKTPARKTAARNKAQAHVPSAEELAVEVSPVSAWKTKQKLTPTTLPSGMVMIFRRVSFNAFMKAGIIPNSLMAVVDEAMAKSEDPTVDDMAGADNINDMYDLMDEVCIFVAVNPPVNRVPESEADRSEDLLYVDEIDDDDKAFIFGVCTGGTADVEQFRKEQAASVADLQRGSVVAHTA